MQSKISKNGGVLAKYSYLADGTKNSAMTSAGTGYIYAGTFVYRRDSTGVLSFESAPISMGRMTASGAHYYMTDHLGSVKTIIRGSDGRYLEHSAYDAWGKRSNAPLPTLPATGESFRYHFSGKEDQSVDFSVPFTDFGARHYSPSLQRWLVPDPLSEKYYDVSPYAYCAGDPVNLVDPDGLKFTRKWGKNTITVSATINADKKSFESAKQAAQYWNNRKTDSYIKDGKQYSVKYKISIMPVSKKIDDLNSYEVKPEGSVIDPKSGERLTGRTMKNKDYNVSKISHIEIDEAWSKTQPGTGEISSTGAHEIGHSLGIKDHTEGTLMSASQDENRTLDINQEQVNTIIESPYGNDDFFTRIKNYFKNLFE